jgi:hypothetical protein
MDEEALFQEYSTNRALQAVYPDFPTYRDFVMSQMPAQANDNSGIKGIVNNAASNMGTIKDLGKNLIMNKLSSKMGLGLNPIGLGGLVLSGLSGINDKIQSTDFARSKSLADYFDAKSYGGIDARNAAAVANMAQARGLQKQMAQRPSSQVSARDAAMGGGGGGGATNTGASKSSGGVSSSERGAALHG